MKIILTGASGFIGRQLCRRLLQEEVPFVCLIRSGTSRAFFDENDIPVVVLDAGGNKLADMMRQEGVTGIVHLASCFIPEHQPSDVDDLILSNVLFGTRLLEASAHAGIQWFLNTGTFWQHYEGADYDPVNLYAATKQAFEDIARYYARVRGLRFCTLKLCDTYGQNDTRPKIYSLWERIAKSGEVLDMSPGEQLIDIVHVDEVVGAYIKLIRMLALPTARVQNCKSYYVSSGRKITLKELAHEYEIQHNVKLNINWGARPYRRREVMVPFCIGRRIKGC